MTDEKSKKTELDNSKMSFGEHIDELRSRLLKSIYGFLIALVVCLIFGSDILAFLAQPLLIALKATGQDSQLYVSSLTEGFITYIRVSVYSAIFFASPWIFYQLWSFIAAGLYDHEKKMVHVFVPFSAFLFILGGTFFVTVVAPLSFNFFITFCSKWQAPAIQETFITRAINKAMLETPIIETVQPEQTDYQPTTTDTQAQTENIEQIPASEPKVEIKKPFIKPLFTLQQYISLVLILALAFSLAFQVPLVVFILGKLRLVSIKTFQSIRKYIVLAMVIIAAAMTPPDVISQIALAAPMYILYEIGILMLRFWPEPKRND